MTEPATNTSDVTQSIASSYGSNGVQRADIIGEALATKSVELATKNMKGQFDQFMDVFA